MFVNPYTEVKYRLVHFHTENVDAYQLIRDGVACNKFYDVNAEEFISSQPSDYTIISETLLDGI